MEKIFDLKAKVNYSQMIKLAPFVLFFCKKKSNFDILMINFLIKDLAIKLQILNPWKKRKLF